MKSGSEQFFAQAYSLIVAQTRLLASRKEEELRRLIDSPEETEIEVAGRKLQVTKWVQDHPESGSLAVMVDARKNLAFIQQVVAFGVFRKKDGSIVEWQESDYYDHGY
jgi:hypothetical protein